MNGVQTLRARDNGIWVVAVAALAGVAFAMTMGFGFVYDDIRVIVERPELQQLSQWRQILTATWWNEELYRPLTRLSFAFDWTMSGGSPGFFHFVNVVAHALVTAGVFLLARGWMNRPASLVAASLFAVHPVHVEAVANIVGRAEVFATGFAVLAVLAYRWDGRLASAGDDSWRRAIASFGTLAAVLAGVASKESAFAIPGLLLLVDFLDARAQSERFAVRVKTHVILWLASVTVALGWLTLRTQLLGDIAGDLAGPGLYGQGLVNRVLIMAPVVIEYIRLLAIPIHLSADYSPDFISAQPVVTLAGILGFIVVGMCVWAALAARERLPIVTAGLAWVGGTLLVISNLIVPSGVILAERSLYLPSVGFVLVVASLVQLGWERYRHSLVTTVAILAVALGLVRTVTRIPIWRSQDTFFPALVVDAPGSFRSQWVAAMLLYTSGDRDRGEEMLRAALNTYPLSPNTWRDYGNRLQEEGRWNEAAQAFVAMFRIDSSRTTAAAQAVSNYLRAGNLEAADPIIRHLRDAAPHDPYVQSVIGDFAMAMNKPLDAMTWFRRAAWQGKSDARLHYRAAEAAAQAGYCPQFERSLRRVTAIGTDEGRLADLNQLGEDAGCGVLEPGA